MMLAFRLARRELRGGVRGLRIVLACLALGVAVIGAVGTLRVATERGLQADGRRLLGGDLEIDSGAQPLPDAVRDWLVAHGARLSEHRRAAHPAGRPVRRAHAGRTEGGRSGLAAGRHGRNRPAPPGRAGAGRAGRAVRAADQPGRARPAGPASGRHRAAGQRQLHRPRRAGSRAGRAGDAGAVRAARGDSAGGGARHRADRAGFAGHLSAARGAAAGHRRHAP